MNPIGLGQICSFAAAVAVAIAIPVTIYAQQTEQLNGREITLKVTDASDSQDNSIDIAGDSFAETSQETDILGTVGSIPDSSISAETSTATDSRPEQPTEQTESADPASYLPENSSDYWAAIKKAYETKADILRQQRDSGLGNPFAMFEYHEARAKVIEADLHLKRIAKGVIKRTYPFQQIPLDNSVNLPEQATSRPPETVNENVPPASSDPVVPGEELTIESMSDDTFNRRVVVQADHTIRLPMVGTVPVKHQTTEQIARHLESLYGRYIKNAAFFVARARASSPLELDRSRLK